MVTYLLADAFFRADVHGGLRTKYRRQVFGSRRLERVEQIMRDVHADFGAELREFNGEPNLSMCICW